MTYIQRQVSRQTLNSKKNPVLMAQRVCSLCCTLVLIACLASANPAPAASLEILNGEWEVSVEESLKALSGAVKETFQQREAVRTSMGKPLRITKITVEPDGKTLTLSYRTTVKGDVVSSSLVSVEPTQEPNVLVFKDEKGARARVTLLQGGNRVMMLQEWEYRGSKQGFVQVKHTAASLSERAAREARELEQAGTKAP